MPPRTLHVRTAGRLGGLVAVVGLGLGAIGLAACSSDADDPAEQRRERVEARLGETFAQDQVDCIMSSIDETALRALDRTVDLDADSAPLLSYTVAVRDCVVGDTADTTTTDPDPEASTTTVADG